MNTQILKTKIQKIQKAKVGFFDNLASLIEVEIKNIEYEKKRMKKFLNPEPVFFGKEPTDKSGFFGLIERGAKKLRVFSSYNEAFSEFKKLVRKSEKDGLVTEEVNLVRVFEDNGLVEFQNEDGSIDEFPRDENDPDVLEDEKGDRFLEGDLFFKNC